jgi:hypothetical protein
LLSTYKVYSRYEPFGSREGCLPPETCKLGVQLKGPIPCKGLRDKVGNAPTWTETSRQLTIVRGFYIPTGSFRCTSTIDRLVFGCSSQIVVKAAMWGTPCSAELSQSAGSWRILNCKYHGLARDFDTESEPDGLWCVLFPPRASDYGGGGEVPPFQWYIIPKLTCKLCYCVKRPIPRAIFFILNRLGVFRFGELCISIPLATLHLGYSQPYEQATYLPTLKKLHYHHPS